MTLFDVSLHSIYSMIKSDRFVIVIRQDIENRSKAKQKEEAAHRALIERSYQESQARHAYRLAHPAYADGRIWWWMEICRTPQQPHDMPNLITHHYYFPSWAVFLISILLSDYTFLQMELVKNTV